MNEEIALSLLMKEGYNVQQCLAKMESSQLGMSFEIVQEINRMTAANPRIEFLGYLLRLEEMGRAPTSTSQ